MRLDVPVLTTDRLLIRPWHMDDLEDALRLFDVELFPSSPGEAPRPAQREARARWLQWAALNHTQLAQLHQPPYGDRALVLRTSGALIGSVGFTPCFDAFGQVGLGEAPAGRFSAELGLFWAVTPAEQGKGYATEAGRALIRFAFEELLLQRIVATTEHRNLASQRVMTKLGMELRRNPLATPPWLQVVGVLHHAAFEAGSSHAGST